ncbi:MAG: hypothetical protein IJI23_10815, partial [Lachnospiraceae bacterium]|nr:hypothetical protein [Lachnospiraceae bacterium]
VGQAGQIYPLSHILEITTKIFLLYSSILFIRQYHFLWLFPSDNRLLSLNLIINNVKAKDLIKRFIKVLDNTLD